MYTGKYYKKILKLISFIEQFWHFKIYAYLVYPKDIILNAKHVEIVIIFDE